MMMKYKHTHMAFIETLNKLLAENLFKVQDVQELNDSEKVSLTWVKHLTGMKPKDAIELKKVPLVESYSPEDTLPKDGLYRFLLQPDEEHNYQHKRATNRLWSKGTYTLSEVMSSSGNRVMQHLCNGPDSVCEGRADAYP